MMNKKDLKFYRVDNFKGCLPFLVPSSFTVSDLIAKVNNTNLYQ
jgi:hypothetical protein